MGEASMHWSGWPAKVIGVLALFGCLSSGGGPDVAAAEPGPWTLKSALKQIDKETKGFIGIRAEVQYIGGQGVSSINGTGTMYVSQDGRARFDIPGDEPRSAFWLYAYFLAHDPTMNTVTSTNLLINPQALPQYALLGFVPTGNALKKKYDVQLIGEETLDGKQVLFFTLTPKPKDVKKSVEMIRLWIDLATWFPAKQEMLLTGSDSKLVVNYRTLVRDDNLPDSLFRPKIPAGTKKISQ
jgi:outer membrane lipoprotein-sorting protein